MTSREPRAREPIIRRLRASLDARAGDLTVTPAFTERVRRLRRRRRAVRHANQAMAVAAIVVVAAFGTVNALRPPDRLEFTSPPPVTPSPTATASAPSTLPSAAPSPEAERTPSPPDQTEAAAEPDTTPPPAAPDEEVPQHPAEEPSAPADEPRARVFRDGRPDPAVACLQDGQTTIVELDYPEAEGAYVVSLTDPVTVTITGEGFSDVSDSVHTTMGAGLIVYTATFESDADDFGVSELRLEVPARLDMCETAP